jgi:hypothetical protein
VFEGVNSNREEATIKQAQTLHKAAMPIATHLTTMSVFFICLEIFYLLGEARIRNK